MSKNTNKYPASNIKRNDIPVATNTEKLLNSVLRSTISACVPVVNVESVVPASLQITADEECELHAFSNDTDVKTVNTSVTTGMPPDNSQDTQIVEDTPTENNNETCAESTVNINNALESAVVVERLQELGLLPTIRKLIRKVDLQADDITRAAVSIHMLTDNLTEKQAVVVNDFDNKGVDLMKYVTPEYTPVQMFYIGTQLEAGIPVDAILNPAYSVLQMTELQKASTTYNIDVKRYANENYSAAKLRVLRKACMLGVDIETLTSVAQEFDCQQLEHLVALSFEGADLKQVLKTPTKELTAECLYATLNKLRETQDSIVLELSEDSKSIITANVNTRTEDNKPNTFAKHNENAEEAV